MQFFNPTIFKFAIPLQCGVSQGYHTALTKQSFLPPQIRMTLSLLSPFLSLLTWPWVCYYHAASGYSARCGFCILKRLYLIHLETSYSSTKMVYGIAVPNIAHGLANLRASLCLLASCSHLCYYCPSLFLFLTPHIRL